MKSQRCAFVGATLLDGIGSPPLENSAIVVEGREIRSVGASDDMSGSEDTLVIDTRGLTIMPGLIDGHVHLLAYAGDGTRDIHLWNALTFIEEQTLHAAANARTALQHGVTTVRDMDGDPRADIRVIQRPDRIRGVVRDGRLLVDNGLREWSASTQLI